MGTKSTLVIFALIAAMGLVTVVAVDLILTIQEAEAQKPRGCNRSVAANASQGRCVEPGNPPSGLSVATQSDEDGEDGEDAEPSNEETTAEEEKEIETEEETQEESEEE